SSDRSAIVCASAWADLTRRSFAPGAERKLVCGSFFSSIVSATELFVKFGATSREGHSPSPLSGAARLGFRSPDRTGLGFADRSPTRAPLTHVNQGREFWQPLRFSSSRFRCGDSARPGIPVPVLSSLFDERVERCPRSTERASAQVRMPSVLGLSSLLYEPWPVPFGPCFSGESL